MLEFVANNLRPENPVKNKTMWIDTSIVPHGMYLYNGIDFIPVLNPLAVVPHSNLQNLDYANSGHTGFAPEEHTHDFATLENVVHRVKFVRDGEDDIMAEGIKEGSKISISYDVVNKLLIFNVTDVADAIHSHTISNVSGLRTELDNKLDKSKRGQPGGVASLLESGKIPVSQVPTIGDGNLPAHEHPIYAEKSNLEADQAEPPIHWTHLTNIPIFGSGTWREPVANLAALPTTGNIIGDFRLAIAEAAIRFWNGSAWTNLTSLASDHSALTNLGNDDHPQYHNDTRGDARYYTRAAVDGIAATKADQNHTHPTLPANYDLTLNDNQTVLIQTGYSLDITLYKMASLEFVLERGTDVSMGVLKVTFNGTTSYMNIIGADTADLGVTFDTSISGDFLYVNYTSTSTGTSIDFKAVEVKVPL